MFDQYVQKRYYWGIPILYCINIIMTNKQGENYTLKENEKKAFKELHLEPSEFTVEDFQRFVKEQQEEFLMRAFDSPRYDQAKIHSNAKIKKSWDDLNDDLNTFAQNFNNVKNQSVDIIKQTTEDLTDLKYKVENFQDNIWAKTL